MPAHVTHVREQVSGFALSAGRTVPAGGVGGMVRMARSNPGNILRP